MIRLARLIPVLALGLILATNASSAQDWSSLPDLPTARSRIAAAHWYHQIFVIGGQAQLECLPRVDAYDLRTRTWSRKSDAPGGLCGHTAVSYRGKIYVFGGQDHDAPLATTDRYDVDKDTWESAPSLPSARTALAAAVGCDGRIYAVGGHGPPTPQGGTTSPTTFALDAKAGVWSSLPEMPEPRGELTAARGADGRIYAIGGIWDKWETADVQAFDPASGSWTSAPPMATPPASH